MRTGWPRAARALAPTMLAGLALLALAGCRAETTGPVEEKLFRQVWTSGAGASTCGLREDGSALCWGANDVGQLGDGGDRASATPVAVGGEHRFTALALGTTHACGLDATGTALCWGDNRFGELGRGDTTATSSCPEDGHFHEACAVPTPVAGDLRFTALGAGDAFTCGLASGSVYCWGNAAFGQLGVADTSGLSCLSEFPLHRCSAAPSRVALDDSVHVASLAVGYGHACALDARGAVWCWGNGTSARDGVFDPISTPARLPGEVTFVQLGAGGGTCGLTASGVAHCWGPDVTAATVARPVSSPYRFTALSVGVSEACAITATGAASCWSLEDLTPTPVPAQLAFTALSVGAGYRCGAVRVVGAYCWGANAAGQLGDGTTADRAEPAFVTEQY